MTDKEINGLVLVEIEEVFHSKINRLTQACSVLLDRKHEYEKAERERDRILQSIRVLGDFLEVHGCDPDGFSSWEEYTEHLIKQQEDKNELLL